MCIRDSFRCKWYHFHVGSTQLSCNRAKNTTSSNFTCIIQQYASIIIKTNISCLLYTSILSCTTILFVSYNTFRILYGNFADALNQQNCCCNNAQQKYYFQQKHDDKMCIRDSPYLARAFTGTGQTGLAQQPTAICLAGRFHVLATPAGNAHWAMEEMCIRDSLYSQHYQRPSQPRLHLCGATCRWQKRAEHCYWN